MEYADVIQDTGYKFVDYSDRPNGPIRHFKYETYLSIRLTVGMLID